MMPPLKWSQEREEYDRQLKTAWEDGYEHGLIAGVVFLGAGLLISAVVSHLL